MKILMMVTTYPQKPYVWPETRAAIKRLRIPDGVQVTRRDYKTQGEYSHKYLDLIDKHNRARADVLDGGYDALLSIEADMLPPADGLEKLLQVDADIAYGLYASRVVGMWLCFPHIEERRAESITYDRKRTRQAWGSVYPSEGVGMGFTLIHRPVLERLRFHIQPDLIFADDWQLALDAKREGFRQAHHLGVVCGHIVKEGTMIIPDPDADEMRRYVSIDNGE